MYVRRLYCQDIDFQDICDRLDRSAQRAAAVLNGDIQEAISWILKYPKALDEIDRLKDEVRALQAQVKTLQAEQANS
jgi:polyhydroxyalkanoate synthesis regulator phasin